MNAAWIGLCGSALLVVWLLRDALTDMCKEEVRTRLAELPYALLRIAALRIPRPRRHDMLAEWRAELDFILSETDGLPITRLVRGVWYSVGMLRLMMPFADARHVIAAYWWKVTRRLRQASTWEQEKTRTDICVPPTHSTVTANPFAFITALTVELSFILGVVVVANLSPAQVVGVTASATGISVAGFYCRKAVITIGGRLIGTAEHDK